MKFKKVPVKKIVNKIIDECDVILLVLDARDPEMTRNKELEKKIKSQGKKIIYVLNKADLVPKEILNKWKNVFGENTVFISAKRRLGTKILRDKIKDALREMGKKEGKIGIVGYPNVGKSSIINALTGKRKAITGNIAGLTKGEQWINLTKNIKLMDTPGVIEMKDEDDLVISGALRLEKVENPIPPALKVLDRIHKFDSSILEEYFGIPCKTIDENFLKDIGISRNYLKKGGDVDLIRTARTIIKEYQEGKLNYYKVDLKKYGQKRSKDISMITKHLKNFPFIEDAKMVITHLKDIEDLRKKIKKPILGMEEMDDNILIISFGEKTKDACRKKVEEICKEENIDIFSKFGDKIGANNIYIAIGRKIKK
ncbi:GTP-binding protein HSR1-releated protein [Methanocaldococcus vulcanius M7]|uniref:GTP-binding protein HSR1-releated protein n=1 Tax=Methanocaldococcus vulcanius (strain ATCC 700851 / DSM 12094 / M7) TaxID=579137 RepID=C9RI40_METVM|nr:GTPase [Methanocaldococcus vulcanius]ACX73242.1 GTP-binding protein HSR1-releated protein [Methanocaldococcus vulcanius M7]